MGLLLLMGGVSDPNPQSLFVNNELGLAIDIGDRNGASEAKRAWRRNLLTYSEQFDNAAWTKLQSSVTANSATAPDGTTTADSLIEDSSTNTHLALQIPSSVPTNTTFSISVYAKPNGRNWIRLLENNGSGTAAYFDIQNGAVGTVLGGTPAITSVGNGWYRCSIRGTTGAAQTAVNFNIRLANANGGESYTGNGTSGVFIWGAQVELGTSTDYQCITDFNTEFKAAYPNHSLYVDSNGVAPAVYPGDQVGLVIDSSRGGLENLGSDLVSNGTFATDTVWTKGANWTIGSGVATKTGGAANNLTQTISSTAGQWYRITATVTRSAGTLTVSLGTSGTTYAITATGTYTFFIAAGSSTQTLTFAGDSSFAGTVDDVTARLIPGIHPYQTTSGSRPALCRTPDGGRRNLLTYSEQFDVTSGGWTKGFIGITANGDIAPDGTLTADKFTETAVTNQFFVNSGSFGAAVGAGESRTVSCYVKPAERTWVRLSIGGTAFPSTNVWFNLGTGAVGTQAGGTGTIQNVGGGWYRCSVTATSSGAGTVLMYAFLSSADNTFSYTGVLGNGAWFWGAQLETGSSATTYQRVTTTHDVTEASKRDCWGLLADGSDDSLITTSVDFNTWTQTTRRNLLTDTESFGASSWTQTNTSTSENVTTAPDGTTTADLLVEAATNTTHIVRRDYAFTAGNYTASVYAKAGPGSARNVGIVFNTTAVGVLFNTVTGASVTAIGVPVATSAVSIGNGWWRFSVTATVGSITDNVRIYLGDGSTWLSPYVGDGTSGVYLWGAQIELGTLTDYQRVGTDKMTVMAGVRKSTDALAACVVELSSTTSSNPGTFHLYAPRANNEASYAATVNGSGVVPIRSYTGLAAPRTDVVSLSATTSAANSAAAIAVRIGGQSVAGTEVIAGAPYGNFGNYIFNILSRSNGSSSRLNGILYTLIIRGAETPTGTIADFEKNLLRIRAGLGPF